jgi:hypothetical protein
LEGSGIKWKWILQKQDGEWSHMAQGRAQEWALLRALWRISQLAEELLPSLDRLCSMECTNPYSTMMYHSLSEFTSVHTHTHTHSCCSWLHLFDITITRSTHWIGQFPCLLLSMNYLICILFGTLLNVNTDQHQINHANNKLRYCPNFPTVIYLLPLFFLLHVPFILYNIKSEHWTLVKCNYTDS